MNGLKLFLLTTTFLLATSFTISCSDGGKDEDLPGNNLVGGGDSSSSSENLSNCGFANDGEVKKDSIDTYRICKNGNWAVATILEYDTYQWSCSDENDGEIKAGNVNTHIDYICKGGSWKEATLYEKDTYKWVCSVANEGEIKGSGTKYICKSDIWKLLGYKEKYCFENECSYFVDSRDNQQYAYTVIGEQTWMSENLNYNAEGCMIPGTNMIPEGSTCYYCDTYGLLYDWSMAMGFPSSCNSNNCSSNIQLPHKGICPDGWHIPSDDDWDVLVNYVGGSLTAGVYLRAANVWFPDFVGSKDDYGFSALPSGFGLSDGHYLNHDFFSGWWSANESNDGIRGELMHMDYEMNYGETASIKQDDKSKLYYIRCLKD